MGLLQSMKNMFSGAPGENSVHLDAATQLPPVQPPKVKPGSQGLPSFVKSVKQSDSTLPITDRRLANTDVTTLRTGASTRQVVRDFVAASPDLSAAVWSYVRLGIPQKYKVVAKNLDTTFNREATILAQQLITRFNLLPDYNEDGFTGPQSVRAVSESLGRELMMYGSCCGEVMLGKDRLPRRVMPISTTQVEFIADVKSKNLKPVQNIASQKFDLDYPTFIYCTLDQNLLEPYSESPIESVIKPVINAEGFSNDLSRIMGKVIHPRQKVRLVEEQIRKYLSQEAQVNQEKANEEINAIVSQIETRINGLRPEEALVYLDSLEFEIENASNAGLSAEYEVLQSIMNARLATGSKTNGTVLGFSSGSSNIASSEIMLFMRSATGAVKAPVEEFWSRALTISIRLFGFDVTVEFQFDPIDLRPDNEILAFKQTEQMMTLELLSLGMITDDEACLRLTGNLPPAGYKPLAGTMFKTGSAGSPGQSAPDDAAKSNGGSTLNKNLKPDTPDTARGQNKKAESEVEIEAKVEPVFVMPNLTV